MDVILKSINLEGLFTTIIGGLVLSIIIGIFNIIKKKIIPKSSPAQGTAIYLSSPEKSFEDNCIGRDIELERVQLWIVNEKEPRKCIVITGEEGVGKSLLCYTVFKYYLKNHSFYLGWIDCIGKKSIFDIIKYTFKDSRFYRKNKDSIIKAFDNLDMPCVLFIDQVDQNTPLDELEEINRCQNVILVLSGVLREIYFADHTLKMMPFKDNLIISKIFEKHSAELLSLMKPHTRKIITGNLLEYAKGNPFLIKAIAKAKYHYNGRWEDVLQNVLRYEYNGEDYMKNILRQLYKIRDLEDVDKNALSKLAAMPYDNFVDNVFELLNISDFCVKRLCNTYWLVQNDSTMYTMDEFHKEVIVKVMTSDINLKNAIGAMIESIGSWGRNKDNGFRWITPYVEDILVKVQRYAPNILDDEEFTNFSLKIAQKYSIIRDYDNALKWIELCKPHNENLDFSVLCCELQVKCHFVNDLYSFQEIDKIYYDNLIKLLENDLHDEKLKYIFQDYCEFLLLTDNKDDALLLCKKYFHLYNFDFSDSHNYVMYSRYLKIANYLNDEELLKQLVDDEIIRNLYQNEKVSVSACWVFGQLSKLYAKWGDREKADKYMRHMVVLTNEGRGFFHIEMKKYLSVSDIDFAEYMHSCDELLESLNSALDREDAEALYIEGRYQEKSGNYDEAISLFEKAATRDSLRGMCSLALLYYRGQGVPRDEEKARKYWEYCCERGHRGSNYWLGILLLDTNYKGYNKELAIQHLSKAADMGSERAIQKLKEI